MWGEIKELGFKEQSAYIYTFFLELTYKKIEAQMPEA